MMDEIICPACGRPNLIEAEKCWYCQVPFLKEDQNVEEPAVEEVEMPDQPDSHEDAGAGLESAAQTNEDIPEWLKRIRDMKAEEQEKEAERIRWQQQALFAGKTTESHPPAAQKDKPKRMPRQKPGPKKDASRSDTHDNPDHPENADASKDNPAPEPPPILAQELNSEIEEHNPPEEDLSGDLPEGFIPLE